MAHTTALATFMLMATTLGCSQTSGARMAFEVVSIKPTPPSDGRPQPTGFSGGPGFGDPARFGSHNVSLINLLVRAYGIRPFQIVGPTWMESDRYDFSAKVPEGTTRQQIPLMLQAMLEERFRLSAHHETRDVTVYQLVATRGGYRMQLSQDIGPVSDSDSPAAGAGSRTIVDDEGFPIVRHGGLTMTAMTNGHPHMTAVRMSMEELASVVSSQVDRPVKDATGLSGKYNFKLTWVLGDDGGLSPKVPSPDATAGTFPTEAGPTIFEALQQQLGLKLVQGKGPGDVLVIDHINKSPTAN